MIEATNHDLRKAYLDGPLMATRTSPSFITKEET